MDNQYFCPVSARFSTSSFELLTPIDTPIERLKENPTNLVAILESLKFSVQQENPDATDACFAAYTLQGDQHVLISRSAFDATDLERITDELFSAASFPELTGILRAAVSPEGHVVVHLDHAPIAAPVTSAEHAASVLSELENLHNHALIHGGINERFLNPEHPAGRRLFGVGFSEAYAAWRRQQGLQLGDLRADPRFASAEDLRGEEATFQSDNFALAATILSEVAEEPSKTSALEAVQGVNALLQKARQRDVLTEQANAIGDRRIKDSLLAMMLPPKTPDLRIWRITVLIISGLSALMLLWLVIPSSPHHRERADDLSAPPAVQCRGASVAIVDGKCVPSDVYARCGEGTVLDSETRRCVAIVPEGQDEAQQEARTQESEQDIASDTIHPVLECPGNARSLSAHFAFGNNDLNLTQGERTRLSRLTTQCSGEASVVYYVSNPELEARTHTIYKEFRSSTSCGERCRQALPEDPTAVVYVPYIGSIERSADHYLFFECCQ